MLLTLCVNALRNIMITIFIFDLDQTKSITGSTIKIINIINMINISGINIAVLLFLTPVFILILHIRQPIYQVPNSLDKQEHKMLNVQQLGQQRAFVQSEQSLHYTSLGRKQVYKFGNVSLIQLNTILFFIFNRNRFVPIISRYTKKGSDVDRKQYRSHSLLLPFTTNFGSQMSQFDLSPQGHRPSY